MNPFLENLLLLVLAAPTGAAVLASMALLVQGWKVALRSWWYMTLLFLALGAIAALPTLLTGYKFCQLAIFGIACY